MLTCPSNLRLHMAAHVDRLSAHLDDISLVNVWINELISPGITSAADRFVSLMSLQHFLTDSFPVAWWRNGYGVELATQKVAGSNIGRSTFR